MSTRISITAKMASASLALLLMMAGIGLFATSRIGAVNELSMEMRSRWLPATQLIGDLHAYMWQYRVQQSNLIAATTPEKLSHWPLAQVISSGCEVSLCTPILAAVIFAFSPTWASAVCS